MTFSPAPSGFAAVVFDMDGTLLDTEPLYREAMYAACAELGYEMTDQLHAAQVGIPLDVAESLFHAAFGADFPIRRFHKRMQEIMTELVASRGVPEKRGAGTLLRALKHAGIPTAVVTSTANPTATIRLERAGLFDLLDVVVTRSDVSRGKPHPEPFLVAAARLGVAPGNCLAVEDSPNGIRSAHAAGMKVVMVPDLVPASEDVASLCHAVLHDLDTVRATFFPDEAA